MGISPPISPYNLRSGVTVNRRNIRTSKFGFVTVSTIGAILWNDLPAELKKVESLNNSKQKISLGAQIIVLVKYVKKICKKLGYIQHQKPK